MDVYLQLDFLSAAISGETSQPCNVQEKQCSKCKRVLPAADFYNSRTTRSKLSSYCKSCTRSESARHYRSQEAQRRRREVSKRRAEQRALEREQYRQSVTSKVCTKCHEERQADQFARSASSKDGLQYWCRECQRLDAAQRRALKVRRDPDPLLKTKRCTKCCERLPISQFSVNGYSPDGYNWNCRGCARSYDQARYWAKAKADSGQHTSASDPRLARIKRLEARAGRKLLLRAAGVFDIADKDLRKLQSQACAHCGDDTGLTLDHIIPIARGGRHSIGNLQVLCRWCNSSKSDRLPIEWRAGRSQARYKVSTP